MQTQKILIVDDDIDLLATYETILQARNHTVVTASSTEAAINLFNENTFDIILLDLIMEEPDSGLKLCSRFRVKNKNIKIYLLSAVGEHLSADIDIKSLGFNGAIEKPLKPDELINLVSKGII